MEAGKGFLRSTPVPVAPVCPPVFAAGARGSLGTLVALTFTLY
jgi:hypothetical protein